MKIWSDSNSSGEPYAITSTRPPGFVTRTISRSARGWSGTSMTAERPSRSRVQFFYIIEGRDLGHEDKLVLRDAHEHDLAEHATEGCPDCCESFGSDHFTGDGVAQMG